LSSREPSCLPSRPGASRAIDPIIRPLTFEDLDEALRLSTAVGWNQRLDDWRMLLQLAPAGAFAALVDRRDASDVFLAGTAIGIDYGAFAWIAMMLVDPAYRGHGVGRRLLEAAIGAVPSNVPIRLDATPLGRPLYRRYGFEDEATLSRHVIDRARLDGQRAARTQRAPIAVRPLTDADLPMVIEQDRETFGGVRGAVLDWALRGAVRYAYAVRSNNTDRGPIHYCLGRHGRLFDQIGPVVAGDEDIAHALISAAFSATGDRPVAVDAFDPSAREGSRGHSRRAFAAALHADGFVVQRPLFRMCRPADSGARATAAARGDICEFAILGPEFA
jgi:GNAT superfamily N-acetyltransferase